MGGCEASSEGETKIYKQSRRHEKVAFYCIAHERVTGFQPKGMTVVSLSLLLPSDWLLLHGIQIHAHAFMGIDCDDEELIASTTAAAGGGTQRVRFLARFILVHPVEFAQLRGGIMIGTPDFHVHVADHREDSDTAKARPERK